jgi:hypothetical protein
MRGSQSGGGPAEEACLTRAYNKYQLGRGGRVHPGRDFVQSKCNAAPAKLQAGGGPAGEACLTRALAGGGPAGEACLTRALAGGLPHPRPFS